MNPTCGGFQGRCLVFLGGSLGEEEFTEIEALDGFEHENWDCEANIRNFKYAIGGTRTIYGDKR